MRLLISEGPRFPSLLAFYHQEIVKRALSALANVLNYGVARGEFRPSAAVDYPQVVVGPALAGALWMILFSEIDPIDLSALCDAHLDIIFKGLLSNDPTQRQA
jgi:hypothetical protein